MASLRITLFAALVACALVLFAACIPRGQKRGGETTPKGQQVAIAQLDPPTSHPPERDDLNAPLLRVDLRGSQAAPIPVPYVYGYPLYAEGPALQGIKLLRQDNWLGYSRQELPQPDGVVKVVERFPVLGCSFEGIQEDEQHYVPLNFSCEVPLPKERGDKRPVVGAVSASARPDLLPREPSLAKAFYGEWHAQTEGFGAGEGTGYFDTPHGLIGFAFKKGKLANVSFVFDPAEKRWRKPELWSEPSAYVVSQ